MIVVRCFRRAWRNNQLTCPACHLAGWLCARGWVTTPVPRASYQPQPPSLRINGKQTLLVGLTIVAGSKLGGSGRAAKSPIKHVDGEYKEIGAAYKVAAGQVSKIEAAPWSATRPQVLLALATIIKHWQWLSTRHWHRKSSQMLLNSWEA